jgi:hypothetical protein
VEASDHQIYVLKLAGSGGPNVLFNEAFGSELLRFFGLPVPQWAALALSDEFIDSHPDVWPVGGNTQLRPKAGLHFGSRLVVSRGSAGAYQIIPSCWAQHVVNAQDFAGVLAVDIWANHCDSRQAVYTHIGRRQSLRATFIDHGHMFGGPDGLRRAGPRAAMTSELRLYNGLEIGTLLSRWQKAILSVECELWSLAAEIPESWQPTGGTKSAVEMLSSRREQLSCLFAEAMDILSRQSGSCVTPVATSSIAPRHEASLYEPDEASCAGSSLG